MVKLQKIYIENDEIKLQAEFYKSPKYDKKAVLLTHPHPMYGGNMYNNVISHIFNLLEEKDVSVLRFNFRGVDASNGKSSSGELELTDVRASLDYLVSQEDFENILICGYSYGAAIGCSNVDYLEEVIGYIAISFPWDFMGEKYKKLSNSHKPKYFIQGTLDNVAKFDRFDYHYDFYDEPKEKFYIEGADHFYRGYEHLIGEKVNDILEELF
ncbi:MAG: hypothetical protein GF317_18465 [Candidatus Lokiarchaeota archaeon]|nr:hypothetical protein [Candidatus Lokiarchaeota archaeon]MBD3201500.1 hypothetical protein [Candidatus Lokiarchaeota archaeon]